MKRIDAIIFDLDGTLTRVPSPWRHVHERLGVWESAASGYLAEWLSGRISYEEFCRRDYALWGERPLDELQGLLDEIEINRHVGPMVERLRAAAVPSIIISSGFAYLAHRIRDRFDWEPLDIYANDLVDGPRVEIRVSADMESPISKRSIMDRALGARGLDPAATLAVSDSERDLEMMSACRYRLLVEDEDDLGRVLGFLP